VLQDNIEIDEKTMNVPTENELMEREDHNCLI
jgi:hypothetical protein